MKDFTTFMPTRLIFGCGTVNNIGEVAKEYGKKAMIVTTGSDLKKLSILDKVIDPLKENGMDILVYDDISPNPKTHQIDKGVEAFKAEKCDIAIGVGGGSAMDAAKAIALIAWNGGSIYDYVAGGSRRYEIIKKAYPIICVSTTSGTGSEATQYAVITNPETHEKPGLSYDCLFPVVSIIDPELTCALPRDITAETGIDAFYHAMEAYLSTVATPYADIISLDCMRIVAGNLEKALTDGSDIEARAQMAWAGTLGGIAIALTATVGIHAIGNSISGLMDVAHGRALSSVGVAYLEYTWDADVKKYAEVARILGADACLPDVEAAKQCGALMKTFLKKTGVGSTITDVGVEKSQIEHITDVTFSSMKLGIDVSLKKLERDDVIKIMESAL